MSYQTGKIIGQVLGDADVAAQKARIEADGGTVVDLARITEVITTLKSMGLYSSCTMLVDARFGVKKDGSGYVSKWYDISGNNNDCVQSTTASQPLWTNTTVPLLTFDGVNDFMPMPMAAGAYNTSSLSIIQWLKIADVHANASAFGNKLNTDGVSRLYNFTGGGTPGTWQYGIGPGSNINSDVTVQIATWQMVALTMDGSSAKLSGDAGTQYSYAYSSYTLDGTVDIGQLNDDAAYVFHGSINSTMVIAATLTTGQITTIYNLGL
jgi:hypothetical protein